MVAPRYDLPDALGHFGPYGGVFVAETLIPALEELKEAYANAQRDPLFIAEFDYDLKHYVGRPSPIYHAKRWSELLGGAQIHLKREDLNHTGAHKINNCIGQAILARRMGKPRVIAETGAGQHGVATATVAARYGMECVVYMGSEDIKRQAANVYRMKLLGATVVPVDSGSRTLKDALNEAMRDWVTNISNTFYIIGTVAGPHPYPMMVRDFQSIIGREAIGQMQEQHGRQPDAVIACVGGGSNAMGIFYPYIPVEGVRLIGVEAAGDGIETGHHAASLTAGRPGVLHGNRTYLLQDENGQIIETQPCKPSTIYAARKVSSRRSNRAMPSPTPPGSRQVCRKTGSCWSIFPAAATRTCIPSPINRASGSEVLTMSKIQATFERLRAQGRKALIPFITAGDPDPAQTVPLMHTLVDAGADIIELGVPFSDPMADGPTIQRASERALLKGVSLRQVLEMVANFRADNNDTPVVLMGYANPIEAMGIKDFAATAFGAGVDGVLVVDYPPEESVEFARAMRANALDPIFLLAPTSTAARISLVAELASGYVYYVSLKGVTGSAALDVDAVAARIPEIRSATGVPVGVGFGIRDATTAGSVARIADAVVVGSRIIEEIEQSTQEQEDVCARVHALVAELRRGIDQAADKDAIVKGTS